MMILMLAASAVAAPAPPAIIVGTPPENQRHCPIAEAHFTGGRIDGDSPRGFHTLDREPQPQAYLTVARRIDGCAVPMIVPSALTRGR